jgi:hypothetical protein
MTMSDPKKGTTAKSTGHIANTASRAKTGLYASLRGVFDADGAQAPGGVKVAFVPVSVNISHPLDLAVCALLAVAWQVISRLRAVKAGAGAALKIPGAVLIPAAVDPPEASYTGQAWDRLDPWYPRRFRDLSDEYFCGQ